MFRLSLDDLMERIISDLGEDRYECVVAIARGGLLPGILCARYLNMPMETIPITFRSDDKTPLYSEPRILASVPRESIDNKKILLVDDVSNSGATLERATESLKESASITTLVISGRADISLYGEHRECIHWPWEEEATP